MRFHFILYVIRQSVKEIVACDTFHLVDRVVVQVSFFVSIRISDNKA